MTSAARWTYATLPALNPLTWPRSQSFCGCNGCVMVRLPVSVIPSCKFIEISTSNRPASSFALESMHSGSSQDAARQSVSYFETAKNDSSSRIWSCLAQYTR